MKSSLAYSFLLGCLATEAVARHGHIINQVSRFAQSNAGGLSDITFPMKLGNVDHDDGFYFAQTWYFDNAGSEHTAYMGLQPTKDAGGKTVLHAAFSSFITNTTTNHPNCHYGADRGNGVSCAVDISGASYDHVWNLTVAAIGDNAWRGTMTDTTTNQEHEIGVWAIPDAALIRKNQIINFFEYYPFNVDGLPDCRTLPSAAVTFFKPTSNTGTGAFYETPYEVGDCKGKANASWKELSNGAWYQSAGFASTSSGAACA
ncbi:hypothetical protein K4F52_005879 [Lecanicillium sp. MT-2017a]|nr:hypothetical protein K4F52_005879 [Lecanicillium sp. MT-2017a]